MSFIEVNGSVSGTGGGQVLRSAVALASVLSKPVRITNIRSGRSNPGLLAQHMAGVRALAAITNASVTGLSLGSQEVMFDPGKVSGGEFFFDVGSAGSATLVLQAILPALTFADKESVVRIRGGTHVSWSPPYHFMEHVFLKALAKAGMHASAKLIRYGWYPKGGGEIEVRINPVTELAPVVIEKRGTFLGVSGIACSSGLPKHVLERESASVRGLIPSSNVIIENSPADCPGNCVILWADYEFCSLGASALGAIGKRSEAVGAEAAASLISAMGSAGADVRLSDQLLIYMSLARGVSIIKTSAITEHMRNNALLISQFTGKAFEIDEKSNIIKVDGIGVVRR